MLFAKYFECEFLDDVYEARTDGMGRTILKNFENEEGDSSKIKEEMAEIIEKIPNEEIKKQLSKKLEQLEDSFVNEEEYLCREYYKFGVTDNLQYTLAQNYRRNKNLENDTEKISNDKVLDILYDIRTKKFESNCWKRHIEPKKIKEVKQSEQELIEIIKKLVLRSEKQEGIVTMIKFLEDEGFFGVIHITD